MCNNIPTHLSVVQGHLNESPVNLRFEWLALYEEPVLLLLMYLGILDAAALYLDGT